MDITIDFDHHSGGWPTDTESIVKNAVSFVLEHLDINEAEVSVVLADDDFVQDLNRDYRGKDKPTNVLSFPQDLPMMGDIILAYTTVLNEADEQNKSFKDHFSHLCVHGLLHLLGYDHIEDEEAQKMESLEIAILAKMGVNDPYETQ